MRDLTVVYYTSNTEEESFASKIREQLVKAVDGKYPIISVSQKPIDLGKNICVGEVTSCDWNAFRQLHIGISEAKTKYIAAAEADTLYPSEYFDFDPPGDRCYRYMNIWCMKKWIGPHWGSSFKQKHYSECAQIANREYWLGQLEKSLHNGPIWRKPEEMESQPHILVFTRKDWEPRQNCLVPIVNIKTGQGLRNRTGTIREQPLTYELPYWGSSHDLRKKLFGECFELDCKCYKTEVV